MSSNEIAGRCGDLANQLRDAFSGELNGTGKELDEMRGALAAISGGLMVTEASGLIALAVDALTEAAGKLGAAADKLDEYAQVVSST